MLTTEQKSLINSEAYLIGLCKLFNMYEASVNVTTDSSSEFVHHITIEICFKNNKLSNTISLDTNGISNMEELNLNIIAQLENYLLAVRSEYYNTVDLMNNLLEEAGLDTLQ